MAHLAGFSKFLQKKDGPGRARFGVLIIFFSEFDLKPSHNIQGHCEPALPPRWKTWYVMNAIFVVWLVLIFSLFPFCLASEKLCQGNGLESNKIRGWIGCWKIYVLLSIYFNFLLRFLASKRGLRFYCYLFIFVFWWAKDSQVETEAKPDIEDPEKKKKKEEKVCYACVLEWYFHHFVLSWLGIANMNFAMSMIRLIDVMSW